MAEGGGGRAGPLVELQPHVFLKDGTAGDQLPFQLLLVEAGHVGAKLDPLHPRGGGGGPVHPPLQRLPLHGEIHFLCGIVDGFRDPVAPIHERAREAETEGTALVHHPQLRIPAGERGAREPGLGGPDVSSLSQGEAPGPRPGVGPVEELSPSRRRAVHGGGVRVEGALPPLCPLLREIGGQEVHDAAQRTGPVQEAGGPPHNLHASEGKRIDRDRVVRRGLGQVAHPLTVLQNQDAVAVEPPDHGPRGGSAEGAHGDPGLSVQHGAHGRGHSPPDVLGTEGLHGLVVCGTPRGGSGGHQGVQAEEALHFQAKGGRQGKGDLFLHLGQSEAGDGHPDPDCPANPVGLRDLDGEATFRVREGFAAREDANEGPGHGSVRRADLDHLAVDPALRHGRCLREVLGLEGSRPQKAKGGSNPLGCDDLGSRSQEHPCEPGGRLPKRWGCGNSRSQE